jgi:hypothetical protein
MFVLQPQPMLPLVQELPASVWDRGLQVWKSFGLRLSQGADDILRQRRASDLCDGTQGELSFRTSCVRTGDHNLSSLQCALSAHPVLTSVFTLVLTSVLTPCSSSAHVSVYVSAHVSAHSLLIQCSRQCLR